jgi:hypothetical protein
MSARPKLADLVQSVLTTSNAFSNWVSTPAASNSGEFLTLTSGPTPPPSIHCSLHVYQPATGMRSTYPPGRLTFGGWQALVGRRMGRRTIDFKRAAFDLAVFLGANSPQIQPRPCSGHLLRRAAPSQCSGEFISPSESAIPRQTNHLPVTT